MYHIKKQEVNGLKLSLKTLYMLSRVRLNFEFGSFFVYAIISSFIFDFLRSNTTSKQICVFHAVLSPLAERLQSTKITLKSLNSLNTARTNYTKATAL